eukprot:TRINITY_DN4256_c0_g2_i4.p1 TRINITY_DN4256_c0_g2~~TRINITY_DN4256_c0_g2_i4.p1  ORF type:complete len:151 (+),score=41.01 TRINITY_DN4256_c0_g2_i4:73-525(+)
MCIRDRVYVVQLDKGKTLDNTKGILKECKEFYFMKVITSDMIYFGIKKMEGCERIVEALKSQPEITAVQEWDAYVETRKGLIGLEEKKEMTDTQWDSRPKKEVAEPTAVPQRPKMAEHSKPYTATQYYPCYPSQGYSYQHLYSYPRPPYQ